MNFWFIDRSIHQNRGPRIGASDIPALIPDPDRPTQSLAGYGRTAVTVYEEKLGERKRDPAGLAAEMGHWNEPKSTELFLREIVGPDHSMRWLVRRMQYEMLSRIDQVQAADYQITPFHHSIEFYNDQFVVHPDGLYIPDVSSPDIPVSPARVQAHGLTIDLSKPFLIEAKNARYWSAKRRDETPSSGYDFDLRTWQGIPLKNYVQIQFQLALFELEICYLPLLYDTSQFQVWEIKADPAVQNRLIDIAGKLAWHIEHRVPPKDMAMNLDDIKTLYPLVDNDFTYVAGDERDAVVEACRKYRQAEKQEKRWGAVKKEMQDVISVHLKDRKELRDEHQVLVKWTERSGSERVRALKSIAKDDPVSYRYLKRKGLIEQTDPTRYPSVAWKEDKE